MLDIAPTSQLAGRCPAKQPLPLADPGPQSVEPFVQRSPFVSDTQIHHGTSVTTGCIVCYTQRRNPTPNNNKNNFVSSILRPLTMWHCLHLLLSTVAAERQSAINQCLLPAGPTAAKPQQRSAQSEWDRQYLTAHWTPVSEIAS